MLFRSATVLPFLLKRVLNEERVLLSRLDGYADYARRYVGACFRDFGDFEEGARAPQRRHCLPNSHKEYYGTIRSELVFAGFR